jgi:hypothetical protein
MYAWLGRVSVITAKEYEDEGKTSCCVASGYPVS